jgi:hypothetical protein
MNWEGYYRGLISGTTHAFPCRDKENRENISQQNWSLGRGFNPGPPNKEGRVRPTLQPFSIVMQGEKIKAQITGHNGSYK